MPPCRSWRRASGTTWPGWKPWWKRAWTPFSGWARPCWRSGDRRLYRSTHATFADYCRDRWDLSKTHANRLIDAAAVVPRLTPIGVKPDCEGQVRPLTTLPPGQQPLAWQQAVDRAGGRPTAAQVAEVVRGRFGPTAAEKVRKTLQTAQDLDALHSNAGQEWWTPPRYVEAARAVLGGIDLDPASCDEAQETVKAARYYSRAEDGLARPWGGRVFLNPPYGRGEGNEGNQGRWSARLLEDYRAGNVTAAVLLVNAVTEAGWFQPLWDFAICFSDHRVRFRGPGGVGASPTSGSAFVYMGPARRLFAARFRPFGRVVVADGPAVGGDVAHRPGRQAPAGRGAAT